MQRGCTHLRTHERTLQCVSGDDLFMAHARMATNTADSPVDTLGCLDNRVDVHRTSAHEKNHLEEGTGVCVRRYVYVCVWLDRFLPSSSRAFPRGKYPANMRLVF